MCYVRFMMSNVLLIFSGVLFISDCYCQTPTFTIDPNFNTEELFRDGATVSDILILDDGRYLVGGGGSNWSVSPVAGFGMIFSNGNLDQNWGYDYAPTVFRIIPTEDGYVFPTIYGFSKETLQGIPWVVETGNPFGEYFVGFANSPYNVERVWDIYKLENSDLLIAGAIASDTLLPGLFRGITRIHSDGAHDPTFPIINITPNNAGGAVREIFPAPDGSWYISGSFTAINGHETNHVAKLDADFAVDTTFVSPFMYDGPANNTEDIILVDDQSRVWVSGYRMRLQENPTDTIQLCRLTPNGLLDTTFPIIKLKSVYPISWMTPRSSLARGAAELDAFPGNYLIYGSFSHYNDTLQHCITVINDDGIIQDNFFQGQGATEHKPYDAEDYMYPAVDIIKQLDNGSLLIGGGFSEFMGETHHNLVKLKQGFVGVEEVEQKVDIKLYPNPASDKLNISLPIGVGISGSIFNVVGKHVLDFPFVNSQTQVDIRKLEAGIYVVKVQLENRQMGINKFVKQ